MKRNPRILNLITSLSEGGVERQLCQLLPKLNQSGFEIMMACTDSPGKLTAVLRQRGVEVSLARVRSRFHPIDIYRLVCLLRKKRIDLVHTHMYASSIPGVLAARWARVPVVVHVHNLHEWDRPKRIRMACRIWPRATRVIAISHSVKQNLIEKCRLDHSKTITLYNGVDLEHFAGQLEGERERQRWGIGPREIIVGSVARLVPAKGLFDLLRAMAVVQKERPEACLVLVGGGDLRSELEQEALRLGVKVVFTGTQEDVRPLIAMFDLAVLASHTEGFGIFLLEAMALSKPVVATKVGGIPEVVVDGETGSLVPPGEPEKLAQSILAILKGDREKIGRAGRQRVEKVFSLEKTLAESCRLYREILEN